MITVPSTGTRGHLWAPTGTNTELSLHQGLGPVLLAQDFLKPTGQPSTEWAGGTRLAGRSMGALG